MDSKTVSPWFGCFLEVFVLTLVWYIREIVQFDELSLLLPNKTEIIMLEVINVTDCYVEVDSNGFWAENYYLIFPAYKVRLTKSIPILINHRKLVLGRSSVIMLKSIILVTFF